VSLSRDLTPDASARYGDPNSAPCWHGTCLFDIMPENKLPQNGVRVFSSILLSERAKLTSLSKESVDILSAPGSVAPDDQPPLIHDQSVEIHTRRIDNQKFRQIEAALDRINHGEFVTCQECGEAIARRRLDAIPWAAYCVPVRNNSSRQRMPIRKPRLLRLKRVRK